MKRIVSALAVAAAAMLAVPAHAATAVTSGQVKVQTNVITSCQFDTSGGATANGTLNLPDYNPLSGTDLTNGPSSYPVTVLCTPGLYKVTLGNFTGELSDGANKLTYALAADTGAFPVSITAPAGVAITSAQQTFHVVATIAKNQLKPVGTYSETVTLTLEL